MESAEKPYEANSDGMIPLDLFISRKKGNHLNLKLIDSSSNLVFSVDRCPNSSPSRLLSDSSGNPLISIYHQKEIWNGFRRDINEDKDLMFTAERTKNTLSRVEFQVFLNNGNPDDPNRLTFKMRGSPFYRSCTIYKGDSIVAQTSLMYKLGIQKVLVPRNRFRLTIFPGHADHAFIVALIVIFFYGRKLWI
ncbi:hypothetical protein CTI12_AA483960 [Artemisia annua]|uniref:Tubby C-terminal-like domain-containing protein n=1 Tax=Artemisia annua TaxID=35608 RepID=A0A2U1LJJ4_ARTAN|nr:hypothetical protein CTI12_AA483960 [Artemisia annua]